MLYFLSRHWLDMQIFRFLSLAVQVLEFEVKPLKFKKMFFALDTAFSIKRTDQDTY